MSKRKSQPFDGWLFLDLAGCLKKKLAGFFRLPGELQHR
jgi:hypothetical protein